MCWIYIQGCTHICTLYIVYMVFKLSCSVTCHAHVHTTKQSTPVLIHRFTTSRALMLTPQSPKCSQALAHLPPPPRGPWGPLCNTFDARPISFVLHVTLGCQMSTWVVEPDLSSAQSSFILSKKHHQLLMALMQSTLTAWCIMHDITIYIQYIGKSAVEPFSGSHWTKVQWH